MTSYMVDDDLTSFVSRPELKAPVLQVTKHLPDLVSDGYIFMAPYVTVDSEPFTKFYQPCQVGPHIWTLDGDLVWSGACQFSNANPYDFKLNRDGGNATTLSLILGPMTKGKKGRNVIIGPSLQVDREVSSINDLQASYMHEFSLLDGGQTALNMQAEYRTINVTGLWGTSVNGLEPQHGVRDEGFREIDLRDNSIRFQWWAMDHLPITETPDRPPLMDGDYFDVYHINSLERTAFGHYIVSMRHTDTIYMISGQDGSVIWRFGGKSNSFKFLNAFRFSGQHDARIMSEDGNGKIVMSFFNNGGTTFRKRRLRTDKISFAMIVELDTSAMTAKLLHKYSRPDSGMTLLRGNTQTLPNGNVLAGYSSSGYFAEFTGDGKLAMDGHLSSTRMSTYRTFHYGIDEVKLFPAEPIALVCRTMEVGRGGKSRKISIMYVSWNGATEVTHWKFAMTNDEKAEGAVYPTVGTKTEKRGFETVAQLDYAGIYALAYGLDKDGNVLGKSEPVKCEDIVEVSYIKQPVDPKGFRRPPGSASNFRPKTPVKEPENEREHELENELKHASESQQETGKEEHQNEKEPHEIEKQSEQRPSNEIAKAGDRPANFFGVGRVFEIDTRRRDRSIMFFLFVSCLGGLLLIKRFRRLGRRII